MNNKKQIRDTTSEYRTSQQTITRNSSRIEKIEQRERISLDDTKSTETKIDGDLTQGKTTLISSSLGAGIERRFKNGTRNTCSYVKRGAAIKIISNGIIIEP